MLLKIILLSVYLAVCYECVGYIGCHGSDTSFKLYITSCDLSFLHFVLGLHPTPFGSSSRCLYSVFLSGSPGSESRGTTGVATLDVQ